jgi:crossover junction endodeoxyribonuclease RuvC
MFRTFIPTWQFPRGLRLTKAAAISRAGRTGPARLIRRIIGVDPGLASSGWGVIEFDNQRLRYIAHGCIETKADRPRTERLFFIYGQFSSVLETYRPAESAVETLYFGRNVTSAIAVAEARGVLSLALAQKGLAVREYTPNAIKQAVTGGSRADKSQVQEMVRLLLGLDAIPKPDHAADALAAAICCAHSGPEALVE